MGFSLAKGGSKILGGGGSDANKAFARLSRKIMNFKPIRYSTLAGESEFTKRGMSFTPSAEFAGYQGQVGDLFGRSLSAYQGFDPATASDKTLALLRQRRAEQAGIDLSRLESRMLQQGRLGLGTGGSGANPELTGFFSAEAMADLEAQLAAEEETRRQGSYLFGQAASNYGLFQNMLDPNAANMFTAANMILQNNQAAAGIRAQGINAEFLEQMKERGYIHDVGMQFMNMWGGGAFT